MWRETAIRITGETDTKWRSGRGSRTCVLPRRACVGRDAVPDEVVATPLSSCRSWRHFRQRLVVLTAACAAAVTGAMAHSSAAVVAAYQREQLIELRRRIMERWAAQLDRGYAVRQYRRRPGAGAFC